MKNHVRKMTGQMLVVGLAGALVATRPGGASGLVVGVAAAITGVVFLALLSAAVRRWRSQAETAEQSGAMTLVVNEPSDIKAVVRNLSVPSDSPLRSALPESSEPYVWIPLFLTCSLDQLTARAAVAFTSRTLEFANRPSDVRLTVWRSGKVELGLGFSDGERILVDAEVVRSRRGRN